MTQLPSALLSLVLFMACGRADQAANPQIQNEAQQNAEAEGIVVAADQMTPIGELGTGVEAHADNSDPLATGQAPASELEPQESETVSPPTQVTGTYLYARLVQETDTAVEVGFSVFHDGARVSLSPEKFQAIWSLTEPADPLVKASLQKAIDSDKDMVLTMTGESLKAIRAQYQSVNVLVSITDLLMNKTTSTVKQSVMEVLQASAEKEPAPEAPASLDPNL